MRLYEDAPKNFDLIKTYYPVWYWEVLEMVAIWRALGLQLDDIQAGIIQAVDNNFVSTADAETLSKLESFLYITYDGPRTLEERRALISSFFIGNGHIGRKEIIEIVSAFTSGEISVALVGGTIEISVTRELSDRFNLSDCTFIVSKRIPAHLGLLFNDVLLPIRFVNKEVFKFIDLHTHFHFYNGGSSTPVTLNGQNLLDGTWKLDQLSRGIVFTAFAMTVALQELNRLAPQTLDFSAMPIPNKLVPGEVSLALSVEVKGKQSIKHRENAFVGAGVTQTYGLSGHIVIDSMYELDGAVLLNGTRKLNANIIEEDI